MVYSRHSGFAAQEAGALQAAGAEEEVGKEPGYDDVGFAKLTRQLEKVSMGDTMGYILTWSLN